MSEIIAATRFDAETINLQFFRTNYLMSNDDARALVMALAAHVWPELTDANALRFLANEMLVRENERLCAELDKGRTTLKGLRGCLEFMRDELKREENAS